MATSTIPATVTSITGLVYAVVPHATMTTWMCDNGYHSAPRHWGLNRHEGYCAGTVATSDVPLTLSPCACECHDGSVS